MPYLADTNVIIRRLISGDPLLPEIPTIYPLWRNLIDTYNVVGRQVYDARLVAVMMAHGISHLLTLNPTDFRRFPMITVMTPQDVKGPLDAVETH